jgi:PAS domain S-box-containing protein
VTEFDPHEPESAVLRAERQRSADTLARLRDALEGVSDGVLVLDRAGTVLEVNPAVAAETDIAHGEIVGVPFLDLWHAARAEDGRAGLASLAEAIRSASEEGETTLFHEEPLHLRIVRNAREIAVQARVTPRYREGLLCGAIVYLRFLTEKERLRHAVRAGEDRYRLVFAAAGDPMALLDDGGRYLEINDRYSDFSGYERGELLGQPVEFWALERRDRDVFRRSLQRLEPGKTVRMEITRTRKDSEHREVDLTLTGVSIAGQFCGLVVERDVTARRHRQLEAEVAARVGRLLVDSFDVRAVLPAIAEQIRRLELFSRMTVLWPDEEREGYRVFASWELEGVLGPSAGTMLPTDPLLQDVRRQGRPARRTLRPPAEPHGVMDEDDAVPRGQLVFPLVHRGGVVGLVTLDGVSPEGGGAERGMEIVAPALAAAVENARLFRRLRESEEKFRTLVENAREIIFRRGVDGEYRYINPVVEQALGYQPEAFYRDPELVTRLIHPADRERHREVFQGMLEGTDYPTVELRLRHRSGKRWVWFLLSVFPLRDPAGNLVALEGILRDITNRREAEAAAREYERRLLALGELSRRLVRERSPRRVAQEALRGLMALFGAQGGVVSLRRRGDSMDILASDGVGSQAVAGVLVPASASPGTSPLLRAYISEEIVEVTDLSTVPRDSRWAGELVANGFLGTVAAPLDGGEGTRGALALHFFRPAPLGEHGRTVLRLAAAQVTAALERADQVKVAGRQAAGAERADRDLGTITQVLSRDLRAPVASLAGLAEMLSRPGHRAAGQRSEVVVDRILENARALERTLDGLVRILRTGGEPTTSSRVDSANVIGDLVAQHAKRLAERGGSLDTATDWPEVSADEEGLRKALDEMMDNAVRFAGRQGAPLVRLGWISTPDPKLIEIHVEDNGPGLAPADRVRAFEPFVKLEGSEDHPGVGVGLTVARRLAEMMGGELALREGREGGCLAVLRLHRTSSTQDASDEPAV